MQSLLQTEKECYICRNEFGVSNTRYLEKHHIFGASNRNKSEQYGLWVWLDHDHHNENVRGDAGIHFNQERALKLKQEAQQAFMSAYPYLDFIELFGRNYL